MTKWPWLMIILALISTVQWPNSIAIHNYDNNANQEEYLWYSRKNHRSKRTSLFNGRNILSTTTSSYVENRKIGDREKINNLNIRSPTSNVTKFPLKNEHISNNNNMQIKSSSTIVFPSSGDGKITRVGNDKLIPDPHVIEKCSMNGSFCTKVDNYPRLEVLRIYRSSKFMGAHPISIDDTENEINDVQTRISNNLRPICESREEVIFPEAGLTKNNEWLYIVQDHNESSGLKQGIKVEMCSKSLTSNEIVSNCKFNDYLPDGFSSVCVQKYIFKKLMTIDNSKEIYYEKFLFPSCCTCMYSEGNTDTKTRRGGEGEYRRNSQNHMEP